MGMHRKSARIVYVHKGGRPMSDLSSIGPWSSPSAVRAAYMEPYLFGCAVDMPEREYWSSTVASTRLSTTAK